MSPASNYDNLTLPLTGVKLLKYKNSNTLWEISG
jgi:hypothetical protein